MTTAHRDARKPPQAVGPGIFYLKLELVIFFFLGVKFKLNLNNLDDRRRSTLLSRRILFDQNLHVYIFHIYALSVTSLFSSRYFFLSVIPLFAHLTAETRILLAVQEGGHKHTHIFIWLSSSGWGLINKIIFRT